MTKNFLMKILRKKKIYIKSIKMIFLKYFLLINLNFFKYERYSRVLLRICKLIYMIIFILFMLIVYFMIFISLGSLIILRSAIIVEMLIYKYNYL